MVRSPAPAPRAFKSVLSALDLDEFALDRGVDRLMESGAWPIHAVIARRPIPLSDPVSDEALRRLAEVRAPELKAWALALRGRLRFYRRIRGARQDLDAALRLAPSLAQARLWKVEVLMKDDSRLLRRESDRLAAEHPRFALALAVRAAVAFRFGAVGEARSGIERAVALEPKRAWLRVVQCEILTRCMSSEETVAAGAAAARLAPRSPWAHLLLARAIYNVSGDKGRAASALDAALALAPGHLEGRMMRAESFRRRGRFAEALREYAVLGPASLDNPRFVAWHGALLRQMGRLKEALVDLDKACSEDPDYPLPFVERAHARLVLGDYKGALADMNAAARLDSNRAWVYWRPGEVQEFEAKLALLAKASAKLPRSPWPKAWIGESLLRAGRLEEGVAALNSALKIDPDCARALVWRGEAFARLGRSAEALADFARALELDPAQARAQGRFGIALAEAGRLRPALKALNASLKLDPSCAWALAHRGELKILLGRPQDALADLDRALNQHRDYADALLWRGMALGVLRRDGRPDIARAAALGMDRDAMARWLERAKMRMQAPRARGTARALRGLK